MPSAVEAWSLNHWATRELLSCLRFPPLPLVPFLPQEILGRNEPDHLHVCIFHVIPLTPSCLCVVQGPIDGRVPVESSLS